MTDVPMPKLSMNMSEGTVVEWLVEDGAMVEEGQEIAEIESEKSTAVIDAPASGVVSIAVEAGERVEVGVPLATIDPPTETSEPVAAETSTPSETDATSTGRDATDIRATPSARRAAREQGVSLETVAAARGVDRLTRDDIDAYAADETSAAEPTTDDRATDEVRASPAARKAARDRGIDLTTLDGRGPDGAVVLADVESAATALGEAPEPTVAATTETDREAVQPATPAVTQSSIRDRRELTSVRETIAERLGRSWREAPHVTVDREIDVGRALDTVSQLDTDFTVDVSIDDLLLVAVAQTLSEHPDFNATFENGEHVRYERADVAIAVDTDRGLISPVLRDVDGKSFTEACNARRDLVEATLDGSVDPDRLEGGTFTVTNLGMFGVSSFTPIINPPQVAILGISEIQRRPREGDDGGVTFRDVMTASLSFDHRVVDGADAARFLQTLDSLLSRPLSVVVD